MSSIRSISLLVILCYSVPVVQAQSISYVYDQSGNRIERNDGSGGKKSSQDDFYEASESDTSGIKIDRTPADESFNISIFPNPTNGLLQVNIISTTIENSEYPIIYLFDTNGKLLLNRKLVQPENQLDLSRFPPGNYILKAIRRDEISEWIIVKE